MQGYGVKFLGEGNPMRGQNERAIAAVYQIVEGRFQHVWPKVIAMNNPPVLLPASSPFARADRPAGPRGPRRRAARSRGRGLTGPSPARRRPGMTPLLRVADVTKQLRRLQRAQPRLLRGRRGRDPGADRPQRLRQDDDVQLHLRRPPADGRVHPASAARRWRGARRTPSATGGSRGPSRSRARSGSSRSSRTSRWPPISARDPAQHGRGRPARARREVLTLVGLPADDGARRRRCSAPAASRSSSWPGRSPPGRKLLLADESLGGLDAHEMASAAEMLKRVRGELGVTIVWVEHIMATLMRHRGPGGRAGPREKIAEGRPGGRGPGSAASWRPTSARAGGERT